MRHDGRETLAVKDEYDVPDLLSSSLKMFFEDVRPKEWARRTQVDQSGWISC